MTNEFSTCDVLVVGNGALGLALGYCLARQGLKTTIVGPASRRYSASQAAGAMNGCFGEVTRGLLSSAHGRHKLDLDVAATKLWDSWCDEISELAGADAAAIRRRSGTTVVLNGMGTEGVDTENFRAIKQSLDEYDQSYQMLEGHEVPWIAAQGSSRPFRGIHIPGEHSVDTPKYLPALELAFRAAGGVTMDGNVRSVTAPRGERAGLATLDDGNQVSAATVVLAAGALSQDLLSEALPDVAAMVPPMLSGYGTSILLNGGNVPPPPSVIRTPTRAFACGLHAVPRDGSVYVGATNRLMERPQTTAAVPDLAALLERAMHQLHSGFLTSRVLATNVGNRPVPIDGFPLIGRIEDTGLWMMTGTYRDGYHQSPYLAKELSAAIQSGLDETPFDHFAPVRAPIQMGTRAELLNDAAEHALATGFEADWRVAIKWPARIREVLHAKYAQAVSDLHEEFTPPPDVLVAMVDAPWLRAKLTRYYEAYPPKTFTSVLASERPLLSATA